MKAFSFFFLVAALSEVYSASAQCYPDRHSTNFFDGWISCEPAASPNPARPASHFILYDFNKVYALGQMKIWNTNDPDRTADGFRDVAIDVSPDGQTWTQIGEYTFERAPGLTTYEGFEGPDLGGAEGRFLLLTALSNYGGTCYGLSEMRVAGEEVMISATQEPDRLDCIALTLFPNPFVDEIVLGLSPDCAGRLRVGLYDEQGRQVDAHNVGLTAGQAISLRLGAALPAGTYLLTLDLEGQHLRRTLVKMSRS